MAVTLPLIQHKRLFRHFHGKLLHCRSQFHRPIETELDRYRNMDQIDRLAKALGTAEDQRAASIIHMCMLTGSRLGEALTARFERLKLEFATWSKLATTTKQRKVHRLPISPDVATIVRQRQTTLHPAVRGCPSPM